MSGIGTELKINVHVEPIDGYRMADYDFTCDFFIYSNRMETITKEQMIQQDEDNYVALVDSARLGTGCVKCRVKAQIPDSDFPDGLRTEVETVDTGIEITK